MCNCCGDCCGMLRAVKKHPKPNEIIFNDYLAQANNETCDACETCIERCQMEAIHIADEGYALVESHRCIGCGLCVTTCPSEAMRLERKPEDTRQEPPKSSQDLVTQMMEKRGTSLIPLSMRK
jgi:MinD superfamily P-loop ATPase